MKDCASEGRRVLFERLYWEEGTEHPPAYGHLSQGRTLVWLKDLKCATELKGSIEIDAPHQLFLEGLQGVFPLSKVQPKFISSESSRHSESLSDLGKPIGWLSRGLYSVVSNGAIGGFAEWLGLEGGRPES